MATIVKPEFKYHKIRIRNDGNDGEFLLVQGGPRAYLWAGFDGVDRPIHISGKIVLRKLANAILKEINKKEKK